MESDIWNMLDREVEKLVSAAATPLAKPLKELKGLPRLKARVIAKPRTHTVYPGAKFGRWEVVSDAAPSATGKAQVLCRCSCGTEVAKIRSVLTNGFTSSCGCKKRELAAVAREKKSLAVGHRVGDWTLRLGPIAGKPLPKGAPSQFWWCECVCGNKHVIAARSIHDRLIRDCGHCGETVSDRLSGAARQRTSPRVKWVI